MPSRIPVPPLMCPTLPVFDPRLAALAPAALPATTSNGVLKATDVSPSPSKPAAAATPTLSPQQLQPSQPYIWERNWVPVAPLASLDPSRPIPVMLMGQQLVVWRHASRGWVVMRDLYVPPPPGAVVGGAAGGGRHAPGVFVPRLGVQRVGRLHPGPAGGLQTMRRYRRGGLGKRGRAAARPRARARLGP